MNAFTTKKFGGNIAGVVTDANKLNSEEMQKIASKINVPTTGFVLKREKNEFEVRFFTPTQEIDMCGHVVVGTFVALAEEGKINVDNLDRVEVKQYTKVGLIPVEILYKNGKPNSVIMKQNRPIFKDPKLNRKEVSELLGVSEESLEKYYPIEIVSTALRHLFIPIKNLDIMKELKPNFSKLGDLSKKLGVETINVFTLKTVNPDFNVHSRDFCPGIGNPEEAASGTTNGALGCYLIKNKLLSKIGKNEKIIILAEQGYEMGKPSSIRTEITLKNNEIEEVKVGGTAICSLKGEITIE